MRTEGLSRGQPKSLQVQSLRGERYHRHQRERLPVRKLGKTENEIEVVHTYAFEVSVDNSKFMKITRAEHDLRELEIVNYADGWISG